MKPTIYKCVCGKVFKPSHWPYVFKCQCGAQITVEKPYG